jgi:signal transduction histidine kinase
MVPRRGLGQRLGRAFLLQALLIGLTGVLGVFAAAFTIKEILIKRALEQEAAHYWERRASRAAFPTPDTRNLFGYLVEDGDEGRLPPELQSLAPGFHELAREDRTHEVQADFSVVYVSEDAGRTLYLVFDGERVGELALLFGLLPLAVVIVVLYLGAWAAYRLSRSAVSPIEQLAERIQAIDPASASDFADAFTEAPPGAGREVAALSEALAALARRVESLLERERNFTRDASHELRSPLTVMRMASDLLLQDPELRDGHRAAVERIQRATRDMEELTEALLLLARESDAALSTDWVELNAVVRQEVQAVTPLLEGRPIDVAVEERCRLAVRASDKVLAVLVGNLLRNAVKYTDEGSIRVCIAPRHVEIEDSGEGMSESEREHAFKPFFRVGRSPRGGFGVGLTIVKRLSDRFGWPVAVDSELGVGTRVRVDFPGSEVRPLVGGPAPPSHDVH